MSDQPELSCNRCQRTVREVNRSSFYRAGPICLSCHIRLDVDGVNVLEDER